MTSSRARTGARPRLRLRRLVVAVAAAAVLAPVVQAVETAPATAANPIMFGAYPAPHGNESAQTATTNLESAMGRKLELVRMYVRWDQAWPDSYSNWLKSTGHTLVFSVKSKLLNGSSVPWRTVADSQPGSTVYNQLLGWANRVKAWGDKVYFTYNHEPEASASGAMGTNTDFIDAWRKVVTVFRQQGVTNAEFLFIATDYSYWVTDSRRVALWYPGDAYVDDIGADAYNWYNCRPGIDNPWWTLQQVIDPLRQFGLQHPTKGLWLPEWASEEDPATSGRKATWIQQAQQLFQQPGWEQFRAILWFDHVNSTYPGCTWFTNSSTSSAAAFRTMANDPYYSGKVAPNQPPTARMSASCTDLTCSVDGTASSDPDGTIASHAWSFGDTTTGSGATTSHSYGASGTYTITLTVTDNSGATATTSQQVTVSGTPPPNQPPHAVMGVSCTNLTCSVNGTGSSDPDGTVASYAWNFGDTSTGSGVTTSHTYAAAGPYTITLTVTDNQGATDSTSQPVTVTAPPPGVFSDGFESGNLSAWTSSARTTVQSTDVASGSFAARATTTGTGGAYLSKTLSTSYTGLYAQESVKLLSKGSNFVNLIKLLTPTGGPISTVALTTGGALLVRNDQTGVTTTSSVPMTTGVWHTLRFHVTVSGTTSRVDVTFDSSPVTALGFTTSLGTTGVGRLQFGDTSTARAFDLEMDNVLVGTP